MKTMCPPVYHDNGYSHHDGTITTMCNRTSCAQVHELPQSHFDDLREGTLFS